MDKDFADIRMDFKNATESQHVKVDDELAMIERRLDSLIEMCSEQRDLLAEMVQCNRKILVDRLDHINTELVKRMLAHTNKNKTDSVTVVEELNSRARSLLDAIENKGVICLDREIVESLVDFLQSEELRNHMVTATVDSLKDMIRDCFSKDMAEMYLPLLQSSHRRLVKQVTKILHEAFDNLVENSDSFSNSIYKASRLVRGALEQHQRLMEEATRMRADYSQVLQTEFKQWGEEALEIFNTTSPQLQSQLEYEPPSSPQPANPGRSIIDQLMKSAEISKKIQEGDLNGSFEEALSASDLSLVMVACRAVDPSRAFSSYSLKPAVLMSLAQQLTTDMVHETQLKCLYLEEALIILITTEPMIRAHLPLVVGEIRKNLFKFLNKYPGHASRRRMMMIIMASEYLLR